MKLMRIFLPLFCILFSFISSADVALRTMPVQDSGRIKPYDTFANEVLEIVYGKKKYESKPAWQVVFTWMLAPEVWAQKELFEVKNADLKKLLSLDLKRSHFNGAEIFEKDKFLELMQELKMRRESKEKLNPYYQALQRLENQYFVFSEMALGKMLRVIPQEGSDVWMSVAELKDASQEKFSLLSIAFIAALISNKGTESTAMEDFNRAVVDFNSHVVSLHPEVAKKDLPMRVEVHYNDFHPFRWAAFSYVFAALFLILIWILGKPQLMRYSLVFLVLGFALHTYGFLLRMYLAGRAPVTNMYETVVWTAWGGVLFAIIIYWFNKKNVVLLAGYLAAAVSLIIADAAPAVLDSSLQPLEAVLRSNYWLTVHVMTITISYSAFLLAFFLGDIGLFLHFKKRPDLHEITKDLSQSIYRCIQIGVAFLGPGIILGGIWADESWGRFWGWDPKETWALIVFLGYLAILHGRMTSWIKDFAMLVCAVLSFSLVVMAWYGVNFVLGAGLHSYGFGAGGVEYVSAVVFAHVLLVIYVSVLRKNRAV